ncbi:MAG: aminodeoxychorismate synthase, component I [Rhodanobacteraceae bacterium]
MFGARDSEARLQKQQAPRFRALSGCRDLLPLASADPRRYPGLLQSAASAANARWDILFAFPQETLSLHADGRVRDASGVDCGARFLDALDRAHGRSGSSRANAVLPFTGGWLLYLGYELAQEIEPTLRLPRVSKANMPIALALRCPAAILVDRVRIRTWLVAESGAQADLLDTMQRDLDSIPRGSPPGALPHPLETIEDDPRDFLAAVERIHHYLRSGDTFQVNLSRQWRARYASQPHPAAVYESLRRANPAPFAGLLQYGGWAIASSSPERLLEIRDGIAQTRPIAGTRPRVNGDDDAARISELLAHAKERAEHVMLIDLERNDLGRICVPGSVRVDELMTVESYAHVHHIVSNVRGCVRDVTPGQAIAAVFPGGTITGCPKVRCMEIIAELERVPRGVYTGALGYLCNNGDLDLNILIRTLHFHDDEITFRAGAGIVADSDARHELEETRAKARGLLRALDVPA